MVDDDPKAVELIAVRILGLASTVLRAYGGREAIDTAQEEVPDLIVLDLMLPEISGFDVVEALRTDESTRSIPIMVLTAKDLTSDDKRQLNGHVAAILSRGATGAPDLLGWLNRLVTARTPA